MQILPAGRDPVAQAQVVMGELLRLKSLPSSNLGMVALRSDRAGVEIPGAGAHLLRGARHSNADGGRGNPPLLAPARDPRLRRLAAGAGAPRGRRCGSAGLGRSPADRPLARPAAPGRGRARAGDRRRRDAGGPRRRVAGGLGTGHPPAPARAAAGRRPQRQGAGVRPRRRAGRRLGPRRSRRGPRMRRAGSTTSP